MPALNRTTHKAPTYPERVLQFGTGVLLRGLPDFYIDNANKQGIFNGSIVIVKSTDGSTDEFAAQDNLYTVAVRGMQQGQSVEGRGNRDLLNDLYGSQSNGRSLNALGDLGLNFKAPTQSAEESVTTTGTRTQQQTWLSQNKLDNKPANEVTRLQIEGKVQSVKPQSPAPQGQLAQPLARSADSAYGIAGKKMALPQPSQGNDSQAARYGQRLQSQNSNRSQQFSNQPMSQMGVPNFTAPEGLEGASSGFGMGGGGMGGLGGGVGGQMAQTAPATLSQADQSIKVGGAITAEATNAAFMASLDVDLPVRGNEYFFTTPRGEVELSAQGISTKVYQRLYAILAVLAIAAAAWVIYLLCVRLTQTRWGTTAMFGVLILFGAISLVQGYLPNYGGLALLAAVVLIIARLEMRAERVESLN